MKNEFLFKKFNYKTLEVKSIEDVEEKHLRHEARYLYMQYLVARGYSDYWKGNMFVEE